ncbi:MAG: O-antigen ligase family protein, partial [Pseudonocardia sp.]|nr:O-antigen ligase family protein [Pseudonocardia sp.]
MTTAASLPFGARKLPLGLTPLHVGALAVGIGVFAVFMAIAIDPVAGLLVIGAVVGLAVAAYAVWTPTVALTLLIAAEFCNVSGVLEPRVSSVYVAFLALTIAATLAGLARPRYRERVRRNWWVPAALLVIYLVSVLPATILSQTPAATADYLEDWLKNLLMLTVALLLMQMSGRPWAFAAAAVIPMAVICVMMGLNEYVIGNEFTFGGFSTIASAAGADIAAARHAGPVPDANFWGRFLILGLPMALALTHRAWKAARRLTMVWWAGMAFLLMGGVYLTQSRGTLVAAGITVVVWIVAAGPQMRRLAVWLLPLALGALLVPGIGDRLLTISEAFGPTYNADQSLVYRQNIQTVAIKIFELNPIFGTGPGTFATVMDGYAPLSNAGSTGDITATHNLYTEIGSETGIVGLFGWLVFVGGTILLAAHATLRMAGARPDGGRDGRPTRALAAAAVAGLIGWSLASAFLHMAFARSLLLVCAIAGLLYSMSAADTRLDRPFAIEATRRARRGLRFGIVASIATAIAAALVAGTLLTALSRTTWVATADMTLLPTPATYGGYALDLRRREGVLPTYAAVIEHGAAQPETAVTGFPIQGVLTVRAVGSSAEEAAARRDAMVAGAQGAIERAGIAAMYRVVPVTISAPESSLEITTTIIRIVLIATIVEILVVISLSARIRR